MWGRACCQFIDRVSAGATSDSQVVPAPERCHPLVSMVCRSQRAHGLPRCCPTSTYRGSPMALGQGLDLLAGTRLPHSFAGPSPSLQQRGGRHTWAPVPGEPDATTAAPLAFWTVNWAGRPAPGPTVSSNEPRQGERPRCLPCIRGLGQAAGQSTGEKVWDARPELWAVATNSSERG